jgi:NADH:ubiquinone oxidoreductase subunit 3 (subunit A)
MNSSTTVAVYSSTNYDIVAPISMTFAILAVIISCFILVAISLTKQLHTVTYLLTCNTCISSILYCVVQCNNYIYLLFITWDNTDQSCRWRGYFGYMSVVAVIYSYLLQAVSRLFFTVSSMKYRWLISLKTYLYLIFYWMDYSCNSSITSTCNKRLHVAYTIIVILFNTNDIDYWYLYSWSSSINNLYVNRY